MNKLQIKYIDTDKLIPYINNPRINDEAVDVVAASIKEFGFKNPIIIDKGNVIIAGHTRLKAAKKLGLEKVPTIKVEDLTEQQIKAFRIADNKTSEFAEWDMELLKIELEGLEDEFTGFDMKELDDIFPDDKEVIEDDFDVEVPEEPISKRGDIWELGPHRLMVGDSTKRKAVKALMGDKEADLILTDPPYNVDYEGQNEMRIQNDNMNDSDFFKFLLAAFERMYESSKAGAPIYVFHADTEGHNFRSSFLKAGYKLSQCLVWVKSSLVLGRQDYHWRHEPILYGWKEGAPHAWYGDRDKDTVIEDKIDINSLKKQELKDLVKKLMDGKEHTTVIRADKPISSDLHPTMKPITLLGYLIKNSSKQGDIILDPFGGSGSTLIAAEQLLRTAYLMELDEKYADVIVNRYISFKKSDEDVFLIRDGEKISYKDIT